MQQITNLMQKEMSRRDFLSIAGLAILALAGMGPLLELLGKQNPLKRAAPTTDQPSSYGGVTLKR